MALIVLTSASGAPGVTTLGVGLALTWDGPVLLVDADPGAHQAVLAGYLRGQVGTSKGLQRVAEAHRDRRALTEVVSDQTIELTADAAASRRLLPGFGRPANAGLFGPVWPDLADTFVELENAGIDVLVDAGRLTGSGLPQPLVDRADLVGLVTTSDLRSLAAARTAAGALRDQARLSGGEADLGVLLAGENKPYGQREIGRLLGLPVAGVVARDPAAAAVFSDGAPRPRRFERSALARSLHHLVAEIAAWIERRRTRLGSRPYRDAGRSPAGREQRSDPARAEGDGTAPVGTGVSDVDAPGVGRRAPVPARPGVAPESGGGRR